MLKHYIVRYGYISGCFVCHMYIVPVFDKPDEGASH